MFAIFRKELSSFFTSPVGYLVMVAFLVLSLIDFSLNMNQVLPELADPQRPERLLRLAFQGLSQGEKH